MFFIVPTWIYIIATVPQKEKLAELIFHPDYHTPDQEKLSVTFLHSVA
jgi:hypothetical protein